MAEVLPLKLEDLGSGLGALKEFATGDQLPLEIVAGLEDALADKQNTLVPGANITIDPVTNEISAEGGGVWASQPIGVPIPLWTHITGVTEPPTDNPAYRYIKLTASDSYNAGVLTSESVSGSAPLVLASATISLTGSPLNGQTVSLINTERRVLRAGSSGVVQSDSLQGFTMGFGLGADSIGAGSFTLAAGAFAIAGTGPSFPIKYSIFSDGVNGTPRTANENRPKNIGATYYMRIR